MAKGLGVNPGTVSAVLNKLETLDLVRHDRYGAVTLTPPGTAVAECVVRRYETVKSLLTEVLGLDAETAEVDACMMEHVVSPVAVNRMERLVGMVLTGEINLAPFFGGTDRPGLVRCSACEAEGACQAEARVQVGLQSNRKPKEM